MNRTLLLSVRPVMAVASGKGGVGKTTATAQLVLALRREGLRVDVFETGVYGLNVPTLLSVHRRAAGQPFMPIVRRGGAPANIRPLVRHDLAIMSIGLLLAEDQAINRPAATAGQSGVLADAPVVAQIALAPTGQSELKAGSEKGD